MFRVEEYIAIYLGREEVLSPAAFMCMIIEVSEILYKTFNYEQSLSLIFKKLCTVADGEWWAGLANCTNLA